MDKIVDASTAGTGKYDKNGKPNAMNAAWGGQWDAKEIMIAMGAHATGRESEQLPRLPVAFCYKANGGSRLRRHRICQERCGQNGEDRLER